MIRRTFLCIPVLIVAAVLALSPARLHASDHADPLHLTDPNSNITGLFIFPRDDQYIMVFNVRKSLKGPNTLPLSPYEYVINLDLTTPVSFDSEEDRARYGGTIATPEKLHPDASITVHLNDNTTLKDVVYKGLTGTDRIRVFVGERDDPFIFPRFFKTNVISMVLSIPKDAFPAQQNDFILWGVTFKDGKQLDHVGRSVRSQLPRFSFLNTAPPSEHVKLLMENKKRLDDIASFLTNSKEWWAQAIPGLLEYTFMIRKYDLVPDVMIYTIRFPPGYPNGRQLADDVNAITCTTGDCLLQELSFIEGNWPRATANDKPFLAEWPYLAEPWQVSAAAPAPLHSILPYLIGALLLIVLVSWAFVEGIRRGLMWLWRRWWQQLVKNG